MAAVVAQRCLEDIYASLEKASTVAPADVPVRFVHLGQTLTLARLALLILSDDIPIRATRVKFVQTLGEVSQRPSSCSPIASCMVASQLGNRAIRRRCIAFIKQNGWALFSMCAHSLNFSNMLQSTHMRPAWNQLCTLISTNAHSIELFGQSRMNWKEPFIYQDYVTWAEFIYRHLHSVLSGELNFPMGEFFGIDDAQIGLRHGPRRRAGHPHQWRRDQLTDAVNKPTMRYHRPNRVTVIQEDQMNISQSIFLDDGRFRWVNRNRWHVRNDPQYRGFDNDACYNCNIVMNAPNFAPCTCTLADLRARLNCESTLVELVRYPNRGVGVRALQAFAANDVLGEYLGEQYARSVNNVELEKYPNAAGVSYRLQMRLQPRSDPPTTNQRLLARNRRECWDYFIDPAVKGNWTRYMNHSCAPSMAFEDVNLGERHPLLVIAVRDVKFGAELTVDYGDAFWDAVSYACNCGERICQRWDVNRKNNPVSLGQYRAMTAAQRAAYDAAAEDSSDGSDSGCGSGSGSDSSSSRSKSQSGAKKTATGPKRQILKLRGPVKGAGAEDSGVKKTPAKGSGVKSGGVKKTPAKGSRAERSVVRKRPASGDAATGRRGPVCMACNQGHLGCGRERPTCAGCQQRNRLCVYPA